MIVLYQTEGARENSNRTQVVTSLERCDKDEEKRKEQNRLKQMRYSEHLKAAKAAVEKNAQRRRLLFVIVVFDSKMLQHNLKVLYFYYTYFPLYV